MRHLRQIDLTYFLAVARHRSMRRASEALHVSPSSLSRQVKKIEDVVGARLLEPRKGGYQLTAAGDLLFQHVVQMIAAEEQLRSDIEGLNGLRKGTIKIAVGEGFLVDFLTFPTRTIAREYPGLFLEIVTLGTDAGIKAVLDDAVDLALTYYAAPNSSIGTLASCPQPLYAVMAPDHPLAGRKRLVIKDLVGHQLALHLPTNGVRQVLAAAEREHGVHLEAHFSSNSTQALKTFAAQFGMVATLPHFALLPELDRGEVVGVLLHDDRLRAAEAQLIVRKGRRLSAATREVARLISSEMQAFRWPSPPRACCEKRNMASRKTR